jgi:hypothetical protein
LFDTVSSYGICLEKENDTEIFGLDAVCISRNSLHLVSADEHRHFFPLVNIKSAGFNEKIFPGVHSDIGGSYVDGEDEFKKGLAMGSEDLVIDKYKKVICDGWYKKHQLKIIRPSFWQSYLDSLLFKPIHSPVKFIEEASIRLTGERKKHPVAYSYIPLHIMCDYAMKEGIYLKFRDGDLKRELNIVGHDDLIDVQKRLHDVVFNNAPEMTFYERFELEHEIEMLRPGGPDFSFYHENLGWLNDEIPIPPSAGQPIQIESFITDPDLIRKIEDHNTILMLRNKYLHWSADWFELGFNPTQSGKRKIYNG